MEKIKNKGLIAATVTPMDKHGNVNIPAIVPYAEYLIEEGIDGVFICGSTGESLLLDTDERKQVAEAWMKYAGRLKILVHVGSTSYKIAADLAKHSEEIGVDAISAMGPCFLPPSTVKELLEFNKIIAASAPSTPYYYYHIPTISGVRIDMLDFLTEAKGNIPTLNGIKYTSYNTMEMQECIEFDNKSYDILHGHDETLLNGLLLGATGGIGTTYNITAPLYKRLLENFYKGNMKEAVALQSEAVGFIRVLLKYVNSIVGIKAMLNILGIDCGPCRLPLRNLTKAEMKNLEDELKNFDWLK